MKNKTASECWNILRGELDSAIDSYVPMKKHGKRSNKKHLSKEAFRKIRYKQNTWWVYINIRERIKIMMLTHRCIKGALYIIWCDVNRLDRR